MKNNYLLLLLLLLLGSCHPSQNNFSENNFRGKTFNLIEGNDTLVVDFYDSTYQVYGTYREDKIPWRITNYKNSNFIVFDNRAVGIEKVESDKYQLTYFSVTSDEKVILEERKYKWKKELILGTWIEEQYLNTEPINIPPPPPPPNVVENDFEFPPYYKITKDSIFSNFYYKKSQSKIDVSNSGEFIFLNLNSKFDITETHWKVIFLSDSVMILNRRIKYPHDNNYHLETETDLKLIKKR